MQGRLAVGFVDLLRKMVYADDLAKIAENKQELQEVLEEWKGVPQLDDGEEGGGHHHVTVLLDSVEHLGIEDHLTYHLRQTPQEMPACRVLHHVSHKHTS